jgi:hypothetical protein
VAPLRVAVAVEEARRIDRLASERLRLHVGNADVARQKLAREKGVVTSLRTVERRRAAAAQ